MVVKHILQMLFFLSDTEFIVLDPVFAFSRGGCEDEFAVELVELSDFLVD